MKRKIYEKLWEWKNKSAQKTALMIDGARRVGKSYIVTRFAEDNYDSYLLIDFNKVSSEVTELFERYLNDLDTFFMYLSGFYNIRLYEGRSLIIFDEVQLFPRARAAVKYLVEDGRYDYIETGSLMSIKKNVRDIMIPSEERHISMFPMDFEEFLWAMGNETLMPLIRENFSKKKEMGQILHRKVMDLFKQYMIVGGMPQAVKTYIDTKDFEQTDEVKRDILTLYREDIMKHADGNEFEIEALFDAIPAELSTHEKKFHISNVADGARMRNYKASFYWLEDAMIINTCYNTTEPNIGLKMNMARTMRKCYMGDTGLLISHAFDENGLVTEEIYKKILFDKLSFNGGMLIENIVAQMLRCSGHKLYFYSNPSRQSAKDRMEIDFLIAKSKVTSRQNISPIEVKSGERYTLSSLRKMKAKYHDYLDVCYVIHTKDYKNVDGITYLPVYMTMLL